MHYTKTSADKNILQQFRSELVPGPRSELDKYLKNSFKYAFVTTLAFF